jgi:hypothetical protein
VVGLEGVELGLELLDGGRAGVAGQPFLEGLVEAFDLAAGLRVIRPGVAHGDAQGGQGDLERDPAAAAWAAGEDRAVVGEHRCGQSVGGDRGGDAGQDVSGLEDLEGVAGQGQAGVVVEQVEDLDLSGVGECPVGDVGLPELVGLVGLEAFPGRARAFLGLGVTRPRRVRTRQIVATDGAGSPRWARW